ncbi:MAG: hypothetical protein ABIR91_00575 [Candidatus Saccharimonadales bacterium]
MTYDYGLRSRTKAPTTSTGDITSAASSRRLLVPAPAYRTAMGFEFEAVTATANCSSEQAVDATCELSQKRNARIVLEYGSLAIFVGSTEPTKNAPVDVQKQCIVALIDSNRKATALARELAHANESTIDLVALNEILRQSIAATV